MLRAKLLGGTFAFSLKLIDAFVSLFTKRIRPLGKRGRVLVTGTFYSDNWLATHLMPMSKASYCQRLLMVAIKQGPKIEGVTYLIVPKGLQRYLPNSLARLLFFMYVGVRLKPNVCVGFHLLFNGLVANWLARLIGAHSVHICGGGAREIKGGGYLSENALCRKLKGPSALLERTFWSLLNKQSLVVCMGEGARNYFEQHLTYPNIVVIAGGLDTQVFYPTNKRKVYDLIFVGRVSEVKRLERALHAIANYHRPLSMAVIGDGPLLSAHQKLASKLNIQHQVDFLGWQSDIPFWLNKANTLILTSDSEGVPQVIMQAQLCGLACIASNVGDISEVVNDRSGILVDDLTHEGFIAAFDTLYSNPKKLSQYQHNALQQANRYTLSHGAVLWQQALSNLDEKLPMLIATKSTHE